MRSAGGAAVVGHVLQAAQQRRVVVGADPLGRHLVLQGHAALPAAGALPRPDHAVDLLEELADGQERRRRRVGEGQRSEVRELAGALFE